MPRPLKLKTSNDAWERLTAWVDDHPECPVHDEIAAVLTDLDGACGEYEKADAAADRLGRKFKEGEQALATMNAVSLHQTNRILPPIEVGGVMMPRPVHPLTCGKDSRHGNLYPFWNGSRVQLICPDCDYTQDNAGPCGG